MKSIRADVVGSMLRPAYLLRAREQYKRGELAHVDFKRIEDQAVDESISIQERCGVDVVTDGEMRRKLFASQLVESSKGFQSVEMNEVDWFNLDGTMETRPVTVGVVGRIRRKRHLSSEEFSYLRGKATQATKITLPSPTMYAYYWVPGVSEAGYISIDAYMAHVTEILDREVFELARLGAEYIQFDAPEFGMAIDPHQRKWFASKGFDPDQLVLDGVNMINTIVDRYPQITFALHMCRGNERSSYMATGGYEPIAPVVFPHIHVQRLILEYDDERSGGFDPLKFIPSDKFVVLGLITTKSAREEKIDELRARIDDATRYIPLERLGLSTQCGFASTAEGNKISFEVQERKLRLVAEVAHLVWGE